MNNQPSIDIENKPPEFRSESVELGKRKKVPTRGVFWRMTAPYREWRDLPVTIRQIPEKAEHNFSQILEGLIDYRLALMKASHMAKNVHQRIWTHYDEVKNTYEKLLLETNKRGIFFHSRKYMRDLLTSWNALLDNQTDLLESIARAPASLKFYNMMMTYQDIRRQERIEDEYNEKRYTEAYNSLELALDYVEEFISKRENNVFEESRILNLEDARQQWSNWLAEINQLQSNARVDIDQILEKINTLKNIIFEAPPLAKWISDIEKRFNRLSADHNLLQTMYGKTIIHQDELTEYQLLISGVIPRLWVTGDYKQLDYYLKQTDTFLSTHETTLQDELAYQVRHSPWVSTGGAVKEGAEIDMLTSFVRIMINAIESREAHMGDHSATVSRLSVRTAVKLNWEPHELKYLEVAGLLHDVGKIWIPEWLLSKSEPLSESEFETLRMHPYYSSKIVESISAFKDIVPWVYYHHERWDGKGYPEGLRENEIPLGASIIAVAEAFSAMIFNTLSRKPLSIDQAIAQVRDGAGKQFDPDVTEPFIIAAMELREELEKLQEIGFSSPLR